MKVLYKNKTKKSFILQLELNKEDFKNKIFDLKSIDSSFGKIIVATNLKGVDSELSWEDSKFFVEKEKKIEILLCCAEELK